ncbi:MAG: hypothetical protein ACRECH_11755 [Nitrososphaerales archaeon]
MPLVSRAATFDYRGCPLSEGYSPLFEVGRWPLPIAIKNRLLKVTGNVTVGGSGNPKKLNIQGVAK